MVHECLLGPKTFERNREFQVIEYFTYNGLKPFLQSIEHLQFMNRRKITNFTIIEFH